MKRLKLAWNVVEISPERQAQKTAPKREPGRGLEDPDLRVVADHEAVGARLAVAAGDHDVLPSSEDSMRPSRPRTDGASSRIECSTSAYSITQPAPTAV